MKIFKFGGASVKNGAAVKNVAHILQLFKGEPLLVVISAMGKSTNALELVVKALWNKDTTEFNAQLDILYDFHYDICKELFEDENQPIFSTLSDDISKIRAQFNTANLENYHQQYDQIVSFGEIISTKIVAAYLQSIHYPTTWLDARALIRTNDHFRDAEVNWEITEQLINKEVTEQLQTADILITQGFIGHTSAKLTTTLGREGSDFTAGIFAYCLNAQSVTIWKDVPGMLNADPKYFDDTVKLDSISFQEAIELSYYGASVIHPKTLKPLQNKNIPLYVKSFIDPTAEGTVIQASNANDHLIPSFIFKVNQTLISFKTRDFSFIVESHLGDIFQRLSSIGAKINLMQNSALSFSILVDAEKIEMSTILQEFQDDYEIRYNEGLELVTIRHYEQVTIDRVTIEKDIILEQYARSTARIVMKNK